MYMNPDDETIRRLLQKSKTIAVVGLSDKPHRDSYRVAGYMQQNGYRIMPVNPRAKTVLGEKAYQNLLDIAEKVDIVNIFRRSEQVLPVVEEALQLKPRAIWLQLGIINEKAAELAHSAGVTFVMDKCIKVEHARLLK
ncbi:CoA-binding protein [Desulfallas sp. Bu1-1]|uniref:CoA-binding protein n=1 Tax=Desulfallas sp. Bu1-1 TaxID=2787620 RepID=UPI0018A07A2A|nr:CoA-binding protein [Desulfallas sp. Bu1-1]MBF7081902.1 CoA-binding protein [Desulfallas sp. Bu1-1]